MCVLSKICISLSKGACKTGPHNVVAQGGLELSVNHGTLRFSAVPVLSHLAWCLYSKMNFVSKGLNLIVLVSSVLSSVSVGLKLADASSRYTVYVEVTQSES